ncbi:MAG: hypothetical protein E7543_07255 [Ruminococcaceae bacterium]|nr:hypothetical protein [Oscillospiraceae bacterium]
MKKALRNLSVMACILCSFCLVMFAAPGVVGFDDSLGFAIICFSIILPFVSSLLWTVFSLKNKESLSKLKATALTFLIIHTLFLLNIFLDFLPFGEAGIWMQMIIGIVANTMFISKTKDKTNN